MTGTSPETRPRAFFAALAASALLAATAAAGQPNVDALLAQLESQDAGDRREAARDLGESPLPEVMAALAGLASDLDKDVRKEAIGSLRGFRRVEAAPGLLGFLRDSEKDHRRDAIRGLVEMHDRRARPGFQRRAMNWIMGRHEEYVLDPLRPVEPEVVDALIGALADPEGDVRETAAAALGALKAGRAVPDLAKLADDGDGDVREQAIGALGEIGGAPAGEALAPMLSERRTRRQALRALGRMRYAEAADRIYDIYDGDGGDTGRDALGALARIAYSRARDDFRKELGNRDEHRRAFAAEGLGRLGDRDEVDGLIRTFLREDNDRAQLAYCFAMVRLGVTPYVDRIVVALTDRGLEETARAYALELGSELLPEYLGYLDDPEKDIRLALIALLERLADPDAIPGLEALSRDRDDDIAEAAQVAVRRIHILSGDAAEPSS